MITENLSTLKIHKLTKEQYDRESANGNIDENALYLTPDEEIDLTPYATVEQLNSKAIEVNALLEDKADKSHTHTIDNVSGLQSALDSKAASSHGTHVSYSTTAPVMDGTASVGSASTVARSDHKHPTDTTRASKSEFDIHVSDTTKHITSTERTNWNNAKTHADSSHAPSNAEKNQNAFSNIAVNGQTTVTADTTTDTLNLAGSNITITTDAANDNVTFAVADGSTSKKGVVQLTNSTSSTSTTTAATPNSVKSAYDLANTAKSAATNAQTTADTAKDTADSAIKELSVSGKVITYTKNNNTTGTITVTNAEHAEVAVDAQYAEHAETAEYAETADKVKVKTDNGVTNSTYNKQYPVMYNLESDAAADAKITPYLSHRMTYNPYSGELTVPKLEGEASRATTADSANKLGTVESTYQNSQRYIEMPESSGSNSSIVSFKGHIFKGAQNSVYLVTYNEGVNLSENFAGSSSGSYMGFLYIIQQKTVDSSGVSSYNVGWAKTTLGIKYELIITQSFDSNNLTTVELKSLNNTGVSKGHLRIHRIINQLDNDIVFEDFEII